MYGCRGYQVACKQWQELKAEKTTFFGGAGYQNPPALSADTFTLITFTETEHEDGLHWTFAKRGCMHCNEPACASVCPVGSLHKEANGAVPHHKMSQDAERVMKVLPWWVAGLGVVLTGTYALSERRKRIAAEQTAEGSQAQQAGGER